MKKSSYGKRELIEKFIEEQLDHIEDTEDIPDHFEAFWTKEKQAALTKLSKEEQMDTDKLSQVVQTYHFIGHIPLGDSIINALQNKPKILERKTITERIIEKLKEFIQTFEEGLG